MRAKLNMQLENLHWELSEMGSLCEKAIRTATETLFSEDTILQKVAHKQEQQIDDTERQIETLCFDILLRQQPVASDLRLVSAALKMISDMERIGDQAADISDISRFVAGNPLSKQIPLRKMADAVIWMVADATDSFVRQDLHLAQKVIAADDTVDAIFAEIKTDLIALLREKSDQSEACLDLLMIAKYYERIGDHAVNVAEWVIYSQTGHHPDETVESIEETEDHEK